MANTARNALCPCGSGKKYKKCCQSKASKSPPSPPLPLIHMVEDDLDELSNQAVDLINERRFDEALIVCERLQKDYPDTIDWLDRSAMLHEARGNFAAARDFYRRALAFTQLPEQVNCFDEEARVYYRRKLSELQDKLPAS